MTHGHPLHVVIKEGSALAPGCQLFKAHHCLQKIVFNKFIPPNQHSMFHVASVVIFEILARLEIQAKLSDSGHHNWEDPVCLCQHCS